MSEPNTITIDDVKYIRKDSIKHIELPTGDFDPWEIGEEYFIETVTKYYSGRLVDVTDKELILSEASWVADTGRFNQFITGIKPKENEPYGKNSLVIISRGALISATKREIFIEVV